MSENFDNYAELDLLRAKLEEFCDNTPQMNRMIMEKVDEVRRRKDILFALEFVDFTRQLYAFDDCSYYDYISEKMRQHKKERIDPMPMRIIQK